MIAAKTTENERYFTLLFSKAPEAMEPPLKHIPFFGTESLPDNYAAASRKRC